MRRFIGNLVVLLVSGALVAGLFLATVPASARGQATTPRPDTKPDLNGIWQAMGTADWDLEDHSARAGAVAALGAVGAIPPGKSVVEGGDIPYKPDALLKKKENAANWLTQDPEVKCYLPGVPRIMYVPFPLQIVQSSKFVLMASEYVGATRSIYLEKVDPSPIDTWMGQSIGRWEGNTLVIESDSFNDQTWFDRSGNFHSDALRVIERITPITHDALNYEATIEDKNVFSRPWKISLPLYRRLDKNAEILEFNCVEFVEETLWGHLRKKTGQ
jgi:hypothetical protein